jgi:hypothetical protein
MMVNQPSGQVPNPPCGQFEYRSSGIEVGRFSNPFDLSVSSKANSAEVMSMFGVLERERSGMMASAPDPNGQRTALTVEDGSTTNAYVTTSPPRSRFKSALTRFLSLQHFRHHA